MINRIKSFFEGRVKENNKVVENIQQDINLAACVILLEIAYSDDDFSSQERKFIMDILKKDFNLNKEEAKELIEIGTKILDEETNKWKFANIINSSFSNEDKLKLIETVWRLIYTDDRLDKWEDHLVHRLSRVLHIPHHRFIEAKLKVIHGKD